MEKVIFEAENLQDLRKMTRNAAKPVIVAARDIAFNRSVIEQKLADILLFPSQTDKEDKLKYLDSGLNLIVARIAAKNKTIIGLDLQKLRRLGGLELAMELARAAQNVQSCAKSGAQLGVMNEINKVGAKALLRSIGASTKQASQAISF